MVKPIKMIQQWVFFYYNKLDRKMEKQCILRDTKMYICSFKTMQINIHHVTMTNVFGVMVYHLLAFSQLKSFLHEGWIERFIIILYDRK